MKLNSFYSRRLHSLLGVIPLGFFLVEHMLTNYSAYQGGKEAFNDAVAWLNSLPLILLLEIFGIWLPLLYHGVYGLYIAYQAKFNTGKFSYFRNQMYFWQRVTGVLTFVFIIWHFSHTRLQVALGKIEHADLAATIHEVISNPILFTLYCIGIVAAVFHFSNGMWAFLVSWGITVGPRAQKISTVIWMGVFVLLSTMFILGLTAFLDKSFAVDAGQLLMSHIG